MDGIETKLAKDMMKPASGFVSALLEPKLEKVRAWAKDKELASLMKEDKILSLLENHLDRTLKKVSYLSTIVFPQEKIPLDSVYEPVHCTQKGSELFLDIDGERFDIDANKEGACYFIVDDAGMGKSTYSKHFCLEVFKITEKVPILFELSEFDGSKSIVENLVNLFDEIDGSFNRSLFRKLIVSGKFFVILDGLDESPSESQEKLRNEIKRFNEKKGKCSLLVTSRPKERMPDLVGSKALKLKKLTKDQALSIFKRYDSYSKLTIGRRLEEEVEKIPERFLETPLLVGLLYRTYGFNNSIAEKISVFYSEIFEALYKGHDLTKSGYVREKQSGLGVDQFRQLLRAFSLMFIASSGEDKNTLDTFVELAGEAQNLCSFEPIEPRSFVDDLLLAVPLLTKDGNSYKFIHRSIAEYFAAEFVARADNKVDLLQSLYINREQFSETIEYLYEIDPNLYREIITLPIAKKFLSEFSDLDVSPLYATILFNSKQAISYWKLDEVQDQHEDEDGKLRKSLNIPQSENIPFASTSYMYGSFNGEDYVAVITNSRQNKNHIPDGAWVDLTEILCGNDNFNCRTIKDDSNIEELNSVLYLGKWYLITDEEIANNEKRRCIQELLARSQIRYVRKLKDPSNSVRILTSSRCADLISSLERVKNAKLGIKDMLLKSSRA